MHNCRMHLRIAGMFALSLLPCTAAAQKPVDLAYATYAAGLNVLRLQAVLDETDSGYGLHVHYRTAGLFGFFLHSETDSMVQGVWDEDGDPDPLQFYSYGDIRGQPRRTLIRYRNGMPEVQLLQPPTDGERDPVPVSMQLHTMDTLSAMVLLIRHVASTGRCDGQVATFDGRRAARISAHTVGVEMLRPAHGSQFAGLALRCDFVGEETAGFKHGEDPDELRRKQHGSAWFARPLPGEPPLPVRIAFETRWFGAATCYLLSAKD